MIDKIIEIFCSVDDFCKEIDKVMVGHQLEAEGPKKLRNRKFSMSDSEVITILILFHQMNYRDLKHFYINHVQKNMKSEFPVTVSYNRFVELQRKAFLPMCIYLKNCCLGNCTGISFIDSTPIKACHIKRERQNKVF